MDDETITQVGLDSPSLESQPLGGVDIPNDEAEKRAPLLMQRPPSFGVDLSEFSFMKPASRHQGFSLRGMPKPGRINPPPLGATSLSIPKTMGFENLKPLNQERPSSSHPEDDSSQLLVSSTDNQLPPNLPKHPRYGPKSAHNNPADTTEIAPDSRRDKIRDPSARKVNPPGPRIRSSDSSRVTQTRQKSKPSQINEEMLFELLIAKFRIREEKEAATADMQQQLEIDNVQLKRENQSLRGQGKVYEEKLLSMEAERKSQEGRVTSWKEKITKFKQIINELGHDFEALRLDSDRLKATTSSLQDERHSLTSSIDEIKLQIVRAEDKMDAQRMEIVDYEKQVARLEQALLASREQLKESISGLANEKKRSNTLESYIQNHSHSQIRQANLLREDHAKLLEKLVSGLEDISETSNNTRDAVLSEIRSSLEECQDSVRELRERCSAETRDVQDFTNTIHDVAARIDVVAARLVADAESTARTNLQASQSIEANTKMIEFSFGSDSTLSRQLDRCNTAHGSLGNTLEGFSPVLNDLDASVKSLTASGNHLVHELKGLSSKLLESQPPPNNPLLELEVSKTFSENTQLQLRLQTISSEAESLRRSLHDREVENQRLQKSMAESNTKYHSLEHRGMQLEADNICLHEQMRSVKEDARKMIDEGKITSKNEMQLHHNLQIGTIERENERLKDEAGALLGQMQGVQDSLINAQRMIDDQREERVALLRESEQQVQHLTETNSEITTRMNTQITEIQRFQEAEAASCLERNDLQERLRQAHERVHELEQNLASNTDNEPVKQVPVSGIVPFPEIQDKISAQRASSPYYDPGDFAMLFMSDDLCPSSPFNIENAKQSTINPQKEPEEIQTKTAPAPAREMASKPGASPKIHPSPEQPKRKAVNFKSQAPGEMTARTSSARSTLTQVQQDIAERPSKMTKHVHKWTYSRVRSSGTEIQHEQAAESTHMPAVEQRTSPKGLVSASSGNKASKRTTSRGRGKRRSRGERYSARFSQE
ncbi:hypothetical protein N7481_005666 [Penicillium waksmanii]|uniref:uncharacterized protein n=1 Tax=Penicillium waksmanii TaxID=69791 RepID=UPI0025479722|nr:uncharacterized protein N7481_005666 [Penicillium waksmanii]KAJ5983567.1 hypothetical protein N7481_005666 [Penicillium waksmanii]